MIAEDTVIIVNELQIMLEEVQQMKLLAKSGKLDESGLAEISALISEMDEIIGDELISVVAESVDRQFRRYGDNFLRQYRCTSGPKKGRLVASPDQCGKRKDPRRVRIGKKAARVKKGIRIRKSKFTKRKTQSKRLSRLNKVLRGDH
jgi:hypothetical protein